MIGTSLSDDGVELLGQRRGLHAYVTNGKTMGIPILYPWANRLSANELWGRRRRRDADPGHRRSAHRRARRADPRCARGLPRLAGHRRVRTPQLTADLDFGGRPRLLATFPFPHVLTVGHHARRPHADGRDDGDADDRGVGAAVFRLSPLLHHPGVPRGAVAAPDTRPCATCRWTTGASPPAAAEEWPASSEPLGDKVFDDGFDEVAPTVRCSRSSGGDRRIEVHFEQGYPAAQVFAPGAATTSSAIEPMAAPTDALRRGDYRFAVRGRARDGPASRSR